MGAIPDSWATLPLHEQVRRISDEMRRGKRVDELADKLARLVRSIADLEQSQAKGGMRHAQEPYVARPSLDSEAIEVPPYVPVRKVQE